MVEGVSIHVEGIVDLEGTPSRQKRRRSVFVKSNFIPKYENENSGGSREFITTVVDLKDGIVKSTQNTIRYQLWIDKGLTMDIHLS